MTGMPLSVTSTANVDPYSASGPMWGDFSSAPIYNKPLLDLSNPLHVAALAAVAVLVVMAWKRRRG